MDKPTRLTKLCLLIDAAGGKVDGRKKLHKLAYLCERAGTDLGQEFVWHMYGVYSPSLAQDVQAAVMWEYISEEVDQAKGKYEIQLSSHDRAYDSQLSSSEQVGLQLVKRLAGESPPVLEVLTTIVYLHDSGYRDQKLKDKLQQLKGHLYSHFRRAFTLAERLKLYPNMPATAADDTRSPA